MPDYQLDKMREELRAFFKEKGMSQQMVADQLGIAQATVSALFKGKKNFGRKSIADWSNAFGFRPNWLLTGEGPMLISKENDTSEIKTILVDTSDLVVIPVLGLEAAAGYGYSNADHFDEVDVMRIPSSILHGIKNELICFRVTGDSMAPTLIDGSHVIAHRLPHAKWQSEIRDGNIYVLNNQGETYIKRVSTAMMGEGRLICISDNYDKKSYPSFDISFENLHNVWEVTLYLTDNI